MTVKITEVTIDDLKVLQHLSRRTFDETFRPQNTPENMAAYLDTAFTDVKMIAELNDEDSFFYFIYYASEPAGYLKLNVADAQTEDMGEDALEIERIYLLKEFQGKGLGKALYLHALEVARSMDKMSIWLGVWEKNTKAIRFYERLGFSHVSSHDFWMGDDRQTDLIMQLYIEE